MILFLGARNPGLHKNERGWLYIPPMALRNLSLKSSKWRFLEGRLRLSSFLNVHKKKSLQNIKNKLHL